MIFILHFVVSVLYFFFNFYFICCLIHEILLPFCSISVIAFACPRRTLWEGKDRFAFVFSDFLTKRTNRMKSIIKENKPRVYLALMCFKANKLLAQLSFSHNQLKQCLLSSMIQWNRPLVSVLNQLHFFVYLLL